MKLISCLFTILLFALSVPALAAEPLPTDPSIKVVELENGLTCWLKQHGTPKGRVVMWLHVGTGSLDERDDQQGLAHFLEHMAFNGSENFEPGELVDFFESIGMRFGQHQNAFTSFDQTTYQMSLPKVDEETLSKGLMCLADYGYRLLLQPVEIDKERKVVLEELRARDGLRKRLSEKTLPQYLPDSRLAKRFPSGKIEVIKKLDKPALQEFYTTWYYPGNCTLLVVGDVDPDRVLPLIRKQFGNWHAPAEQPVSKDPGVKSYETVRSAVVTDPELEEAEFLMATVSKGTHPNTRDRYEKDLIDSLGTWILRRRLNNLIREGKAPFQSSGAGTHFMFNAGYMASVSVSGDPAKSREMLTVMARETHRARRFGFLKSELDQARDAFRSRYQRAVKTEATRDARGVIAGLNGAVGDGDLPMSAQQELELATPMLDKIDLDEVNKAFTENFPTEQRLLMGILPADTDITEDEIRKIVTTVEKEALKPLQAEAGITRLMAEIPKPADITEQSHDTDLDISSATLANGVRLHVRPMDYKEDRVFVQITLTGGLIQETEANRGVTEAAVLAFNQAATKNLTSTQIRDFMTPKKVGVSASAARDRIILSINGAPEDLEHGFQLAHLLLTAPKLEASAFNNWAAQHKLQYKAMQTQAEGRLFEALLKMATDDVRLHQLTPDQVDRLTAEQAQAWLETRIRQGRIEMAITGDLPKDRAMELARTYIGALPPRKGDQNLEDLRRVDVEEGPLQKIIPVPSIAHRSAVFVGWRVPGWEDRDAAQQLNLARLVLEKRLRKEIREDRGWTYSSAMIYMPSEAFTDASVFGSFFTADPDKAPKAMNLARKIISEFTKTGPTAEELTVAQRQLDTMLEQNMREPSFWSSRLAELEYHDFSLDYYKSIRKSYGKWTAAEIQRCMEKWIIDDRRIQALALTKEEPAE